MYSSSTRVGRMMLAQTANSKAEASGDGGPDAFWDRLFILLSLVLLTLTLVFGIDHMDSDTCKLTAGACLNEVGVGGMVWSVMLFIGGTLRMANRWVVGGEKSEQADGAHLMDLLGREALAQIFAKSAMPYFMFAWLLVRVLINSTSVFMAAAHLPQRDFKAPMNLATFVVTWIECPTMIILAFRLVNSLIRSRLYHDVVIVGDSLESLATFSCFQTLPKMSPAAVLDQFKNSSAATKWPVYLSVLARLAVFGGASILSFTIKIHSVSFISDKLVYDWSWYECAKLAALVNNIAGLQNKQFIQRQALLENEGLDPSYWSEALASHLLEVFERPSAIVYMATMTFDSTRKVLKAARTAEATLQHLDKVRGSEPPAVHHALSTAYQGQSSMFQRTDAQIDDCCNSFNMLTPAAPTEDAGVGACAVTCGTNDTAPIMTYVGANRGDYTLKSTYKYVGQGAGHLVYARVNRNDWFSEEKYDYCDVGWGEGSYITDGTYEFVGQGQGDHAYMSVKGSSLCTCVLCVMSVLLLGLILLYVLLPRGSADEADELGGHVKHVMEHVTRKTLHHVAN